jgi:hypothetical protein
MSNFAPVGSVFFSLLDYPRFIWACAHLGVKPPRGTVFPEPSVDPKHTEWVPADGRSVNGSAYHELTGRTNVPDMRGVFLRGANNFDPQWTAAPQDASQLDPSGLRVFGSYQADGFASHTHGFSYREPGGSGNSGEPGAQGLVGASGTTSATGEAETRPKNSAVAYYVCIN